MVPVRIVKLKPSEARQGDDKTVTERFQPAPEIGDAHEHGECPTIFP